MDFDEILDEILPRLQGQADYAFPEFGFKRAGNGYVATKGELRGTDAKEHIHYYDNRPFCFVDHKTGTNVAITKYLEEQGHQGRELLEELARRASYSLPPLSGDSSKHEAKRKREELLDTATEFFGRELFTPRGRETLDYLKGRGYSEEEVRTMGLGHFPGAERTLEVLKTEGHSEEEALEALRFLKARDEYKLVLPHRDITGRTLAIWGRRIDSSTEKKYLPLSSEAEKSVPFNMNNARGTARAILVEGYLDALIASARGLRGVLAVSGASLLDKQIETLGKARITSLVFSFDNDKAGQEGTERSVEKAIKARFRTYVLALPEGFKDVDDYLREHNLTDYEELVENAIRGPEWISHRKLGKYDLSKDQDRDKALDELKAFEETLTEAVDRETVRKAMSENFGISREALAEELESYHERKANERERRTYEETLRDAKKKLDEGNLDGVREALKEGATSGKASSVRILVSPHYLEDIRSDLAGRSSGLSTGYPSLNEYVSLRPALTIVAGRPSHGKTSFLLNLMLNMTKKYTDKSFFFFSYEEDKTALSLKLVTMLSEAVLSNNRNTEQIERYVKGGHTSNQALNNALAEYDELARKKRLFVVDEALSVERLSDTLDYLRKEYDLGAVFVDYAQRVKVEGKYSDERGRNLKVSETLREASTRLSLPIICGAQFNRSSAKARPALETLKESGNYEEDANTVLGIYNLRMAKERDNDSDAAKNCKGKTASTDPRATDFEIHVLKNRGGTVNESVLLTFDAPILKITDENMKGGFPIPPEPEEHINF